MLLRTRAIASVGLLAALLIGASGVQAQATTTPQAAAAAALGRGDGPTAAQIIARAGFATKPAVLAEIIYGGGVLAVDANQGNAFAHAVPVAFVHGTVSLVTANLAFKEAAIIVAREGAKDIPALVPQLAPGGLAIIRTELAYLGIWLPALPD